MSGAMREDDHHANSGLATYKIIGINQPTIRRLLIYEQWKLTI